MIYRSEVRDFAQSRCLRNCPLSKAPHYTWEMVFCLADFSCLFKTVLSSGYILTLLSIENILASLIESCQGWPRMRNAK